MDENEQIWVVTPSFDSPAYMTRSEEEAEEARAIGHKVEPYTPAARGPAPTAPLHSVSIKATDSSPLSATILIDGREPTNVQAIYTEMHIEKPNRCIVVFYPERMDVDGIFEGWARPGGGPSPATAEARKLLEQIRDQDEQLSDGSIGHLARQAIGHLDSATPSYTAPGGPVPTPGEDPHVYISTACQHGCHEECRHNCKFCDTPCRCTCHPASPSGGGPSHG